jgi:hypothetical protein
VFHDVKEVPGIAEWQPLLPTEAVLQGAQDLMRDHKTLLIIRDDFRSGPTRPRIMKPAWCGEHTKNMLSK